MFSKSLLLFCLALTGVIVVNCRAQLRFGNAYLHTTTSVGLSAVVGQPGNITVTVIPSSVSSSYNIFPKGYLALPQPDFPFYEDLSFFGYIYEDTPFPSTNFVNMTLVEHQSYSFVMVGSTEPDLFFDPNTGDPEPITSINPPVLFAVEERPINPPYGSSMIKIVNAVASSYNRDRVSVIVTGLGINATQISVPFASSSQFLQFNRLVNDVTLIVTFANANMTIVVPLRVNSTALVYLRGDLAPSCGYMSQTSYVTFANFQTPAPVSTPTSPPVTMPPVGVTPVAPLPAQLRLVNALYYPYERTPYTLFAYAYSYEIGFSSTAVSSSSQNETDIFGSHQAIYYLNQPLNLRAENWLNSISFNQTVYLNYGQSYSYVLLEENYALLLEDFPQYPSNANYARIVVNIKSYTNDTVSGGFYWRNGTNWSNLYQYLGSHTDYVQTDNMDIYLSSTTGFTNNFSWRASNNNTVATIYVIGTADLFYYIVDEQPLPYQQPTTPICLNGQVEASGQCNCYSGYMNDDSIPYVKCSVPPPSYCVFNQTSDDMSNTVVPEVYWWQTYVTSGSTLNMYIRSAVVPGRRTVVELPNANCNYVNTPSYYTKWTEGCTDVIYIQLPFTECGFIRTSNQYQDTYKGVVNVKQVDRVTVGESVYDRVIETPFRVAIRLPKQFAVLVYGPPSLAIDAAFVGQQVNTNTQEGNLQYVSSVQYPLQIENVQIVDLPWGVSAWVELVTVNCTGFGPCVQRLEIHINTTTCSISGVYRMAVSLGCRSEQGCPEEARNGTQVVLESTIVSQNLCGEVSVDIGLQGSIQAFSDSSFNNPALAFFPGQAAYFLINAYSYEVNVASVTVQSVYYMGPNVAGQYLVSGGNLSSLALSSNFQSGSQGSNQAWFSLDTSVSTPDSGETTLFKLFSGQSGVYNFVAFVDVEWSANAPSSGAPVTPSAPVAEPISPPVPEPVNVPDSQPFVGKKRYVVQGSLPSQGSQFSAQVQIAGPTPSATQPQPQQSQTPVASPVAGERVSSSNSVLCSFVLMLVGALLF